MLVLHTVNNHHTAFNQKNINGDYAYPPCSEPIAGFPPSGSYVAVRPRGAVKHVLQLEDNGERRVTDHLREAETASQDQSLVSRAGPRTQRRGESGGGTHCPAPSTPHQLRPWGPWYRCCMSPPEHCPHALLGVWPPR